MQRRIIISKGKKYLVNVPTDDGIYSGSYDFGQAASGSGGVPQDPYDNILYLSGSDFTYTNPTGVIGEAGATWKIARGHNCVNMTNLALQQQGGGGLEICDITNATTMNQLAVQLNNLSSLDVHTNTALVNLYCNENPSLSSLNVSGLTVLDYLDCYDNNITTLDLHTNTALTYLSCENNGMTSLNINGVTGLTQIYAFDNVLAGAFDLSANSSLGFADFSDNKLTSVNVAGTSIITLNLTNNLLTSGAVDTILAALVVNNTIVVPGSTVAQLDGTGNAVPSVAGLASRTTLTGKGWSVNVNP